VVGFEDLVGVILVTFSGGLASSGLSVCLRLVDIVKRSD
jgi:hypothetical protein